VISPISLKQENGSGVFSPGYPIDFNGETVLAYGLQKNYIIYPELNGNGCLVKGPGFEDRGYKLLGMKKIIKMRQMSDNQKGIIRKVSGTGDMGRRIREMGLVKDTPIQIQGRAPLKDPVAVKIRDYVLTLRNNEANSILVEVDLPEQD